MPHSTLLTLTAAANCGDAKWKNVCIKEQKSDVDMNFISTEQQLSTRLCNRTMLWAHPETCKYNCTWVWVLCWQRSSKLRSKWPNGHWMSNRVVCAPVKIVRIINFSHIPLVYICRCTLALPLLSDDWWLGRRGCGTRRIYITALTVNDTFKFRKRETTTKVHFTASCQSRWCLLVIGDLWLNIVLH